jgi:hypothetical protein
MVGAYVNDIQERDFKTSSRITSNTCPTNFGDLAEPQGDTYSHVTPSVVVTWAARGNVGQNLRSHRVDRDLRCVRILRAAALRRWSLTLVALQITSSATLPDVDYLMMLDKIYLLEYVISPPWREWCLRHGAAPMRRPKGPSCARTGFVSPCFPQPISRPMPPSCCRPWSNQE